VAARASRSIEVSKRHPVGSPTTCLGLRMTPSQRQLVMETLSVANPSPSKLVALERLGDEAFDLIVDVFKRQELRAQKRVNAIRRLGLLTRQQCFDRTEELLQLVLNTTGDSDRSVRAAATSAAILRTSLLEENPRSVRSPKLNPGTNPALREHINQRVRQALDLGLVQQDAELAKRFLAAPD